MIGIFWWRHRIPGLEALLGEAVAYRPRIRPGIRAVAGWGRRGSYRRAARFAKRHAIACLALEDGFLRSGGLGGAGHPPLSLVVDELGIYYDASRPSRLERLIAQAQQDEHLLAEARRAMALIRRHRLSKYNHAPEACPELPAGSARVLVVDQTRGDLSVSGGGADGATFAAMLEAAIAENPGAVIIVKTHPEVAAGNKRGYLGASARDPNLTFLARDVNPLALLEQVDKVYTVTSQLGFEALLLGRQVVCFGLPWYAGWGLTDDRHPATGLLRARRVAPRTLVQLFASAYMQYARYLHPETGLRGDIFDVITHLADFRRANARTAGTLYCVGMTRWKRAAVAPFLRMSSARAVFTRTLPARSLAADARLVVWGAPEDGPALRAARQRGIPVWRMEDGFLRSVGLGSNLHRPLSLVLDDRGIYYDPRTPSALEHWLQQGRAGKEDLARAARLRERVAALRLSKYNLGGGFALAEAAAGKRVLLVPGQVEDDASLRCGAPEIATNRALLQAVRAANPAAHIIYKPHPDVVAGNRRGATPQGGYDQYAPGADIIACILAADEVHTMTSLTGFEALLHGKPVHCYGLPFYAGWGLTQDWLPSPARTRRLSLEELVYGALIHYPRYIHPATLAPLSPERAVELLERQRTTAREEGGALARQGRKLRALLRMLLHSGQ